MASLDEDTADDTPTVKELKALAFDLNDALQNYALSPTGFGKLKRKVLKELQHLQTVIQSIFYLLSETSLLSISTS